MLLEKIPYENDFPVRIEIIRANRYPAHYHEAIELIFVLDGTIRMKNGSRSYQLQTGDFFVSGEREVHGFELIEGAHSGTCCTAVLHISPLFFEEQLLIRERCCYFVDPADAENPRVAELRQMLLHLFATALSKEDGYKERCLRATCEIVMHLETYFRLFAFRDGRMVPFQNRDPDIVQRAGRILTCICRKYGQKITLEQLADQENLSTFYISHLIKDDMGVSFRDLLCFIRIERSEILLLGSEKKVSAIAKEVGFSTTAYYERYFQKWFGLRAGAYREKFVPLRKAALEEAGWSRLSDETGLSLVKQLLDTMRSPENLGARAPYTKQEIKIQPEVEAAAALHCRFEISITLEDFYVMGYGVFDCLRDLACSALVIHVDGSEPQESLSLFRGMLVERGYSVSIVKDTMRHETAQYGWDSLAAAVYAFNSCLRGETALLRMSLRDQGEPETVLKGNRSLFASNGLPKPLYYAFTTLSRMQGVLISLGKYHAAVKLDGAGAAYLILAYNYNEEIAQLCLRGSGIREVAQTLDQFRDGADLHFKLALPAGSYLISRYTFHEKNNSFGLMEKLGFPERFFVNETDSLILATEPEVVIHAEQIHETLELHLSMQGVCMQTVLIQAIEG